jgi:hypothetical protein
VCEWLVTYKMPRPRIARREVLVRLFTWTVHRRGTCGSCQLLRVVGVGQTYWDDDRKEKVRGDVEGYVDGAQSFVR